MDRLRQEVSALAPMAVRRSVDPDECPVQVIAPEERKYLAWIGGSVLASNLQTFPDKWITRSEYFEYGPQIVHTKC